MKWKCKSSVTLWSTKYCKMSLRDWFRNSTHMKQQEQRTQTQLQTKAWCWI